MADAVDSRLTTPEVGREATFGSIASGRCLDAKRQSAAKVYSFMEIIKGAEPLCSEEMETFIWENRFDLLPPPQSDTPDKTRPKLPLASAIPTLQELHDALVGGGLPCGHQAVAHLLYPESVFWRCRQRCRAPRRQGPSKMGKRSHLLASGVRLLWASAKCARRRHPSRMVNSTHDFAAPKVPWPAVEPTDGMTSERPSGFASEARPGSREATPKKKALRKVGQQEDGEETLQWQSSTSARRVSSNEDPQKGDFASQQADGNGQQLGKEEEDVSPQAEVVICGKRVRTTARGRPMVEQSEHFAGSLDNAADGAAYEAAKERRHKMERTVKLEQYQEKKLAERIQVLEAMRDAEIAHQSAIHQREAERQARGETLKKQMEQDWQRRMEEEREAEESEKQRKAKEEAADVRKKRYLDHQKAALSEWYATRSDEPAGIEAQKRLKHQEEEKEMNRLKKEAEKAQKRTLRQLEAEDKVHRINVACEERPPLPPRAHDLPPPVLDMLDGGGSVGSSSSRSQSRRRSSAVGPPPPPLSARADLPAQVKVVSSAYGLSEPEHAVVQQALTRGVRGAGRMAAYEKEKPAEESSIFTARIRQGSTQRAPEAGGSTKAKARGNSEPPAPRAR